VLLGNRDQAGAEPMALALRVNGQQPEVTPLAANFRVDTGSQFFTFEEHEKLPFLKQTADLVGVYTIGISVEALRAKGGVHQLRDGGRVGGFSGTNLQRIGQRQDFTSEAKLMG
jgi:hypothetical protein